MIPTEHGMGQEPSEPLSDGEPFIGICTVISGDSTAALHETCVQVNDNHVMLTDGRERCSKSDPRRARSRLGNS